MADPETQSPEELPQEPILEESSPVANSPQVPEECESEVLKYEGELLTEPEREDTPSNGAHLEDKLTENGSKEESLDSVREGDTVEEDEVLCDFCLAEKGKAVKSCLTCMVNYCQDHLRPHLENAKLQTHKLMDPLKDIDMQSCETHKMQFSWFCHPDLVCICEECLVDGHQGHKAVTCAAARKEKEVNNSRFVWCVVLQTEGMSWHAALIGNVGLDHPLCHSELCHRHGFFAVQMAEWNKSFCLYKENLAHLDEQKRDLPDFCE